MMYADESLRRAAVLVTCLEEADARTLLGRLGTAPADRIRRAVAALGPVAALERENVIRAFLNSRQAATEDRARGVELDEDLARRLAADYVSDDGIRDESAGPSAEHSSTQGPFAFLLETESDVVAPLLARENPQTIAVVLSFLAPRPAAELLRRLDAPIRGQVLQRLANLDEIDAASVDVVAAELRAWIERQQRSRPMTGSDRLVRDLLSTQGRHDRRQVLAELQQAADSEQGEPAPAVEPSTGSRRAAAPRTVAFDELRYFADEDLVALLQAAPQEVLALALAGADEQLVERIVSVLPRKDAKRLRRSIQIQGPTRLTDIEQAQRRIETLATTIREERESVFRSRGASRSVGSLPGHWA